MQLTKLYLAQVLTLASFINISVKGLISDQDLSALLVTENNFSSSERPLYIKSQGLVWSQNGTFQITNLCSYSKCHFPFQSSIKWPQKLIPTGLWVTLSFNFTKISWIYLICRISSPLLFHGTHCTMTNQINFSVKW